MKKQYNSVYVMWIDSEVPDGAWHDLGEEDKTHLVESFGILVKETNDYLVLAISVDKENDRAGPLQYIPKVAIKDMYQGKMVFKHLKVVKDEKEKKDH